MDKKLIEIEDFKVTEEGDSFYVTGYANTKNRADSYGDVPTNYKDEPVYDLQRFKKNPVALVDHENSVGNIFGSFVIGKNATHEDEKGLRFKLRLMENPQTDIAKHAVEAYKSGFARSFSIGGQWQFGDKENPSHLTKAYIHEISGVAIGADSHALSDADKVKSYKVTEGEKRQFVIESLLKEYRETQSPEVLQTLKILINGR